MIVLGSDPGSRNWGYSVCQFDEGVKKILTKGAWHLKQDKIGERLVFLETNLQKLIDKHKVDSLAYEVPFMRRGKNSMDIYICSAVVPLLSGKNNLPLGTYSAAAVKKTATGSGKAEKLDVQNSVRKYFNCGAFKESHSADACAICITHNTKRA